MKPSFTVIFLTVAAYAVGTQAASCLEKAATFAKITATQATCLTTLNLTAADIPDAKDLKEKFFNDRCLSKCVLESLNFFFNGTIRKDAILETLKKEVASDVYDKLATTVETCVTKANTKPEFKKKDKDDNKDNKDKKHKKMTKDFKPHVHEHGRNVTCGCRKAAKFTHCMMESDKDATC